jgi:osmotically-inducible protein OsmY
MSLPRLVSAFVLIAALSGCAVETCKDHPCTPDDKLVEAVKGNIHQHSALLTDQIRVQSEDGTVYLYGRVSTNVELVLVEDVAKSTAGVKKVINLCTIENVQR